MEVFIERCCSCSCVGWLLFFIIACFLENICLPNCQDFQHTASLSFLLFITRRTSLSHQSPIIPLSQELVGVVVPFSLQFISYDTTDYPALHSQAIFSIQSSLGASLFFDQKLQKRTSTDYKHSSSSYQQVSQQ